MNAKRFLAFSKAAQSKWAWPVCGSRCQRLRIIIILVDIEMQLGHSMARAFSNAKKSFG